MSKLVKDETKRLLNVIQDQIESLLEHQNQIPIIEIDLTKESIRKLYQQLDYLSRPTNKNDELEKIISKTNKQTEEMLDAAEKEFSDNKEKEKDIETEPESKTLEIKEDKPEVKEEVTKEDITEDKKPEVTKEKQDVKPVAKNKTEQKSIIDVVASDEETNIGDKFQEANIESLKSAIGINDKFQFINELFEGSMSNYNKFISKLDSLSNKGEALSNVKKTAEDYNWSEKDNAYKLLNKYVKRRFIN